MYLLYTAQKMKFFINDFFSKCDQIRADLVTFTEKIINEKFHFLCSDRSQFIYNLLYIGFIISL